jgi:hypothetical protein
MTSLVGSPTLFLAFTQIIDTFKRHAMDAKFDMQIIWVGYSV